MPARLALALVAVLTACSGRTPPAEGPAAPRPQPLALDGSVARSVASLPDRARVQLDLHAVRAALRAYHAERGAWPAAVSELNVEALSYPADLAYEASTGTVTSRTYPTL
jgi:hypothetical protein